jgi:hypothetical protein
MVIFPSVFCMFTRPGNLWEMPIPSSKIISGEIHFVQFEMVTWRVRLSDVFRSVPSPSGFLQNYKFLLTMGEKFHHVSHSRLYLDGIVGGCKAFELLCPVKNAPLIFVANWKLHISWSFGTPKRIPPFLGALLLKLDVIPWYGWARFRPTCDIEHSWTHWDHGNWIRIHKFQMAQHRFYNLPTTGKTH